MQTPHKEDELYYVVSGRARMRVRAEEREVGPGSLIFVEAEAEHGFFDISEQLEVLVFFAPAERQQWDASHLPTCRLVARESQQVWGWAALSPVSQRKVYAGVAEVSIYVAADARGRGVGRLLLQALIAKSEEHGLWTLQAGIFPENAPSIALHRACGFREVGRRQRIGKLGDRWRDVLLLERSSARVG
jgi:L-amino acid N-acyltransferase YncA